MTIIPRLALLLLIGGMAACTNPDRFDNDPSVNLGNNAGVAGIDPGSDPTSVTYFQSTIGDRVLFEVDQSTLTDEARTVLAQQATWLASNPEYTAVIEGHADEQGTREYNLALGNRRASAVSEYLVAQGVAANRLKTVTYGKERPLEVCSAEACYAKNRRGVTILQAGAGAGA